MRLADVVEKLHLRGRVAVLLQRAQVHRRGPAEIALGSKRKRTRGLVERRIWARSRASTDTERLATRPVSRLPEPPRAARWSLSLALARAPSAVTRTTSGALCSRRGARVRACPGAVLPGDVLQRLRRSGTARRGSSSRRAAAGTHSRSGRLDRQASPIRLERRPQPFRDSAASDCDNERARKMVGQRLGDGHRAKQIGRAGPIGTHFALEHATRTPRSPVCTSRTSAALATRMLSRAPELSRSWRARVRRTSQSSTYGVSAAAGSIPIRPRAARKRS